MPVLCQLLREGCGQLDHPVLWESHPHQDVSGFQGHAGEHARGLLGSWILQMIYTPFFSLLSLPEDTFTGCPGNLSGKERGDKKWLHQSGRPS